MSNYGFDWLLLMIRRLQCDFTYIHTNRRHIHKQEQLKTQEQKGTAEYGYNNDEEKEEADCG